MIQHPLRWGLLLLALFLVSLAGVGYFAGQLRRGQPPPPANYLAADKGYGVTIDLTRYNAADLPALLANMHAAGLTWLRQPVSWAELELSPGRINWLKYRQAFQAVADFNDTHQERPFKLIAVLHTSPTWARPQGSPPTTPPANLADFGRFTRYFANLFGKQIDFYQIWHEPNLSAAWGDQFVDPAAYASLLREAALNIREADPEARILTGALAATTEDGPLNLNEMAYLDQLYRAGGADWFDIVAVQPYGLWSKPLDPPAPDQPNFRRTELVRRVMLAHGDAQTPLWATAFGWVALPANWSGQPSPWSYDLPSVQTNRTALAIEHARANWPWLGPMLAARWDAADLAADDPARGFALTETPPLLRVFRQAAERETTATVGRYPAPHPTGHYSPGWRFAAARADIPQHQPGQLTLFFEGTRLDLQLDRGAYRGYLWVTVDDQPANALPVDGQGRSYVVLYDPLHQPADVTLARGLPDGRHTAIIQAEGGWEQWALRGWTVSREPGLPLAQTGLLLTSLLAAASGGGALWLLLKRRDQRLHLARMVWAWSEILITFTRIPGDRLLFGSALGLGIALYLLPPWPALLLLPLPALLILLRPDAGLALIAFAIFFYRTPLRLPFISVSPVELTLALTLLGALLHLTIALARSHFAPPESDSQTITRITHHASRVNLYSLLLASRPYSLPILALLLLALLSTLMAENFPVALREWRTVILEPILFYALLRLVPHLTQSTSSTIHNSQFTVHSSQFTIHFFVAGATLQAALALYFYFFTNQSIDAEGVQRALGLGYGSPNNLALMLGRTWPILLAVALLPGSSTLRRLLYGLGLLIVAPALYLTFSKGALLLGLPAGLLAMALFYGLRQRRPNWRKLAGGLAGALLLVVVGLIPFSQTERFRAAFDFSEGSTGFFRLKLWQAAWIMLQDYWPLGVGPDNFLYQYRTRYILPEAWQEPNLNHPHNLLLDFGTRLGVGGIILLLWLQIGYWRSAWRLHRARFDPLLLGLMGSMVVFLAHGLVDASYFLVDLAFAFFLNLGLVQNWAEHRGHATPDG